MKAAAQHRARPTPRLHCRVCGRPVAQTSQRGRTKEIHKTCTIIASRVSELERLFGQVEWADAGHVALWRGALFDIVNGPLRPDRVRFNPESEEDL